MARVRSGRWAVALAVLVLSAVALAGGALGATAEECTPLKKRACKKSPYCRFGGKGVGCAVASDPCNAVQGKKMRKKCAAVTTMRCECSKSRKKCGTCKESLVTTAPDPNGCAATGSCVCLQADSSGNLQCCSGPASDCQVKTITGQYACQPCGNAGTGFTWMTKADGTKEKVACNTCQAAGPSPAPGPAPPAPPVPEKYLGSFYISYNCVNEVMKFAPPQAQGICFQGSTDFAQNAACNPPSGCILDGSASSFASGFKTSTPKWYNIGGGGGQAASQIGCAGLNTYSASTFQNLKANGYNGIFYDVETFAADATKECFSKSFSDAKAAGLQVGVGTSYSAPYQTKLVGGMPASDALFKEIMGDTNVDWLSPQFYNDGKTALIVKTSASSITLQDWDALSAGKTVQPTLKVFTMSDFEAQKAQMAGACGDGTCPAKFCATGYWAWPST